MAEVPHITDAEWRILQVLWEEAPLSAQAVASRLPGEPDWSLSTVKTLLNRLVLKGAAGFTREGREHRYHPCVDQAACRRAQGRSFLRRFFGGSLQPFVATLLEDEQVSPEELEALRRLLDEKADGRRP